MMALKNVQEKKIVNRSNSPNSNLRHFHGTVVSNISDFQELHFLTSDGVYYRILKNSKYHQLSLMTGESLKVAAFVHDLDQHVHALDIAAFDLDFAEDNINSDSQMEDIVYSVPEDTFIDYESFNS